MEICKNTDLIPKETSLILGFFDGIHLGHRKVIDSGTSEIKTLVTFSNSPAEYFNQEFSYIYPRKYNYEILEALGINYVYELDFSEFVNIKAEDYLKGLIDSFSPKSISTGFNHTFGNGRSGSPTLLESKQYEYNYSYFCIPPYKIDGNIVSSSLIKKYLSSGDIETANKMLGSPFVIESTVIKGQQIGRKIGFPTANMKYPKKNIKLPYGVYAVNVLNKRAILNWGTKPTLNGNEELLEVHIPDFKGDLYNKNLKIEFVKKIREEKQFGNLELLQEQIKKDVEICLKL